MASVAGIVGARRITTTSRGSKMAFVAMSDASGSYEVTLFQEVLNEARELLESGQPLMVTSDLQRRGDDGDFRLSTTALKKAESVMVGPSSEDPAESTRFKKYRARDFAERIAERAVVDVARYVGLSASVVPVLECLHLKTAVSALDDEAVLVNPAWVDPGLLPGLRLVRVPRSEPWAANVLTLGHSVVMAEGDEETAALLDALGYRIVRTPLSEFRRAEAGPTCLTILVPPPR